MNGENLFPVQYAILELKKEGSYLTHYKDVIQGYIVSKCWVVESSIKYYSNGESEVFHKVVFPYKDLNILKLSLMNHREFIGERVTPSYDFYLNPYPVDVVFELFDSYEEAKTKAKIKNEEIKRKIILQISYPLSDPRFKETLARYEKKYEEQFALCLFFEKLILQNTKDMRLSHSKDDVLKMKLMR